MGKVQVPVGEKTMTVLVRDVVAALNRLAPFHLAYDWDNVGLQIGNPEKPVRRVGVGLEVNSAFLKFANQRQCDMLVVHHPLIFRPLKNIVERDPTTNLLCTLIRREMALVVAHTNLDRVPWGTNGVLADRLGLEEREPVEPCFIEKQYKFVVFVPTDYVEKIIDAIHRGGGGWIGNYSHCTFRTGGTGTYVPETGAQPYKGKTGQFEEAEEYRLEAVVPEGSLQTVIKEVVAVHPYEEVAYDVYPLHQTTPAAGLGVLGRLPRKLTVGKLAAQLVDICQPNSPLIGGDPEKVAERVAIVTGSAGSTVDSITPRKADVIITGELGYHKSVEVLDRGLGLICLGHAASEKIVADVLIQKLRSELGAAGKHIHWYQFDNYMDPLLPIKTRKK
jgi:dinuclear metal center YbgI/SA1388 family protein